MIKKGQICPVCGKHRFKEDDNFEICPICGWEDDGIQRDDPDYEGGANEMSLNQMKKAYLAGLTYNEAAEAYHKGKLDS